MNKQKVDIIKKVSDVKLKTSFNKIIGGAHYLENYKRIIWGAGVSGKSFIHMHQDLKFSYIVDTRKQLQGEKFLDLDICDPSKLYTENPKKTLVFVQTVIHKEICDELKLKGFDNIIIPNQFNTSSIGFNINRSDISNIFIWLNSQCIKYVFLKKIPETFSHAKDIDIMISTDDLERFTNCEYLTKKPENNTLYLDVSWSKPIGINAELPFFTRSLTEAILNEENVRYIKKIRTLNDKMLLHTYITHALIHKGTPEAVQKYIDIISILQKKLNIHFDVNLDSMWNYLKTTEYFPKIDFIRKWAAHNNSTFLAKMTKHTHTSGLTYIVFVFRDFFRERYDLLQEIKILITESGFSESSFIILSEHQKKIIRDTVRGGVWEDSYQSKLGGGPYAMGVYEGEASLVRPVKLNARKFVSMKTGLDVNAIHSSDDEIEAREYIQLLSNNASKSST
jgi:hypothetical protein